MEYDENNLEKMNIKTDALDHRIVTAFCTFHKRTAYRERAFLYPFERILTAWFRSEVCMACSSSD